MIKKLADIKILIVEDNEVNQLVLKRILQSYNIENEIVQNGIEAIEILKNKNFDVILMDIQLPQKNGIETTIEIRNLSNEPLKNIPIIALTANALKGEEQKYKDAGMNGFLLKPFKETELIHILQTVVIDKSITFNTKHTLNAKHYNLSQVYELVQHNEEFVISLVQIFIDTIPDLSNELLIETNNSNWDKAFKLAHKLKSTIDTMQIASIKEDIRVIELNGKNETETEKIPPLARKIKSVIDEVTIQLKEEFNL